MVSGEATINGVRFCMLKLVKYMLSFEMVVVSPTK